MTSEPPLVLLAAVAILVELAGAEGNPVATRLLAHRRQCDVRKTRLLLKRLRAAGLVDIVLGPGGGARLAKAPGAITLADVVGALTAPVSEARRARAAAVAGRHGCVGSVVLAALMRAEQQRTHALSTVTIGDLDDEVCRRNRIRVLMIRAERRARRETLMDR